MSNSIGQIKRKEQATSEVLAGVGLMIGQLSLAEGRNRNGGATSPSRPSTTDRGGISTEFAAFFSVPVATSPVK